MLWPFFNDIVQRIITCNKHEQCVSLNRVFQEIECTPEAKILDFGCGTGLFAKLFDQKGLNLQYVGYDLDKKLANYGQWLHPSSLFTSRKQDVVNYGPYEYILSNCCFHHVSDELLTEELEFIGSNLKKDGYFVVVDILKLNKQSLLQRLYMILEQGEFIRSHDDYVRRLQAKFHILHNKIERSHFLSIPGIPIYNDLGIFVCQPHHSVISSRGAEIS